MNERNFCERCGKRLFDGIHTCTPPAQSAQEPDDLTIAYMSGLHDGKKKRLWVGLTDEEIQNCWDGELSPYQMQCIREIEAKLREKNT